MVDASIAEDGSTALPEAVGEGHLPADLVQDDPSVLVSAGLGDPIAPGVDASEVAPVNSAAADVPVAASVPIDEVSPHIQEQSMDNQQQVKMVCFQEWFDYLPHLITIFLVF